MSAYLRSQSFKVKILYSWLNSEPIVRYTLADEEQDAIKQVCGWFSIVACDSRTFAKAEPQTKESQCQ